MPWPWKLCLHCMDMSTMSFVNWPIRGGWLENRFYLDLMSTTARVWSFMRRRSADNYKWTPEDVDFEAWLDEGREKPPVVGEAMAWALAQGLVEAPDNDDNH